MPARPDQAICIRHWDWSETSQTVSLLGRDLGLVRALAKGSRRADGRFSGGLELLTRGQMLVILKPAAGLATLTAWDLQETFPGLSRRLGAFYAGLYLADVVQHIVHEHDPHPGLFDALLDALRALSSIAAGPPAPASAEASPSTGMTPSPPAGPGPAEHASVLRFQLCALQETGFMPSLEALAPAQPQPQIQPQIQPGDYVGFSPAQGGLAPDPGPGAQSHTQPGQAASGSLANGVWRVRRSTIDTLRRWSTPDATSDATPTPAGDPETLLRANRLLAAYLREVLGRDLPSAEALFGSLPAHGWRR